MLKLPISILMILLAISACKKDSDMPPIDDNVDLDGKIINDSSLTNPSAYLLSAAIPNPTATDLNKKVVITVHGFGASNFEWTEFRDWAKGKPDLYTSLVLLGAHGRDYEDFKAASWENWQAPIIDEYNKLRNLGYNNISIIASSTGCPLVLEMIRSGRISTDVLKHLFFIDPIIIPSNKTLSAVSVIGKAISYTETELDPGENGFWYKYRPQEALKQLEKLTRQERKALEEGVVIPTGISLKVYKSEKDGSADPISAVLLYQGVTHSNGSGIQVEMIHSDLHVFTRLHGRATITHEETDLQQRTFEEVYNTL